MLVAVDKKFVSLAFLILTMLFIPSPKLAGQAAKTPRLTGTYTNMSFNREGGDLLGQELRIVRTRKGYQGVLQFAEGEPSELMIVDLKVSGKTLEFTVPDSSPNACQFAGTIDGGVIRGQFKFRTGSSEDVTLKKGKSYWD